MLTILWMFVASSFDWVMAWMVEFCVSLHCFVGISGKASISIASVICEQR